VTPRNQKAPQHAEGEQRKADEDEGSEPEQDGIAQGKEQKPRQGHEQEIPRPQRLELSTPSLEFLYDLIPDRA
jgi:hypothetical protein